MYLGLCSIDDLITFTCNTHSPTTGAATDADSDPAYRVYEDETGTAILTGVLSKLDDSNTTGFYSEQITLSAANGFENGKSYNIYIAAAVGAVTGTMSHYFQVKAIESNLSSIKTQTDKLSFDSDNYVLSHPSTSLTITTNNDKTGYTLSSAGIQAIWDALTSALTTVGSIGKLLVDNINATISSRLASASYTAPDNASITAIKAKTDNLPSDPADQSQLEALIDALPTASENATAVLSAADANPIASNVKEINDTAITGDGSGTPWGPA